MAQLTLLELGMLESDYARKAYLTTTAVPALLKPCRHKLILPIGLHNPLTLGIVKLSKVCVKRFQDVERGNR